MDAAIQDEVRLRADGCCEYCGIPEALVRVPFQFDHIIAKQHGGATSIGNIAYSCLPCNKRKGPNIAGIDPETEAIVRLFHPRRDEWHQHFQWDGPYLQGRTAIGRATIAVLLMNDPVYVSVRRSLIEEGVFPRQAKQADE